MKSISGPRAGIAAITAALLAASLPSYASAATIVLTLPEYSGDIYQIGDPYPLPAVDVGTFNFFIPTGAVIVAADLSGTFGNSVVANSAGVDVFFDGIMVASCEPYASCWDPMTVVAETWNFSLDDAGLALLADGIGLLTAVQTNEFAVRLGETTLTIQTRALPLPAALPLLLAALAALAGWRRTSAS